MTKQQITLAVIALAMAGNVIADTVIESVTGKPLKSAWVLQKWTRTTFEHNECIDVKVAKTSESGGYSMPFSFSLFTTKEGPYVYKAGYREPYRILRKDAKELIVAPFWRDAYVDSNVDRDITNLTVAQIGLGIEVHENGEVKQRKLQPAYSGSYEYLLRDMSTGSKRLEYLQSLVRTGECFGADSEKTIQPFIEAILAEAVTLIKTPEDTRTVAEICKEIGHINTGSIYTSQSSDEADKAEVLYIQSHHPQCRDILVKASWGVPQKNSTNKCDASGCTMTDVYYYTYNPILNKSQNCSTYEQCNDLAKYTK